jgi:FkbH-like protein
MTAYDRSSLDYFELIRESKKMGPAACSKTLRLAILGDCATQYLIPLLKALFVRNRISPEIYAGEYDTVSQEVCDNNSPLYAFGPEAVVILSSTGALRVKYHESRLNPADFIEQITEQMVRDWKAVKERCPAAVIANNFVLPYERIFGNYEQTAQESFYNVVVELNRRLIETARAHNNVLLNDMEFTASYLGRRRWFDEKLWALCKAFCSFECLPYVAQNIVDITRCLKGIGIIKCVVLDLDDTLWGGTIGDDGLEGIRLGHLGDGESYTAFQHYLLALKKRGIALAVCSHNDPKIAVRPFREHPEMVLKESDISVFIANWTNKADNIRAIQETLNIGLDSIVFLDDNAFERNLVRKCLPEVVVPDLPDDSANYVKALSEINLFEAVSFSDEDRRRASMYSEQVKRQAIQSRFANTEDYLRSLNMRIALTRFDSFQLPRIAQLILRSNQFNLTTKRYSEAECEHFMREPACFPFYVTLKDDLGDSGLISAVILLLKNDAIEIDEWIMSCRVLLRGVEEFTMNSIVAYARKNGLKSIVGQYIPTPKNGMVREFYGRFGFEKVSEDGQGACQWRLDVKDYVDKPVFFLSA